MPLHTTTVPWVDFRRFLNNKTWTRFTPLLHSRTGFVLATNGLCGLEHTLGSLVCWMGFFEQDNLPFFGQPNLFSYHGWFLPSLYVLNVLGGWVGMVLNPN